MTILAGKRIDEYSLTIPIAGGRGYKQVAAAVPVDIRSNQEAVATEGIVLELQAALPAQLTRGTVEHLEATPALVAVYRRDNRHDDLGPAAAVQLDNPRPGPQRPQAAIVGPTLTRLTGGRAEPKAAPKPTPPGAARAGLAAAIVALMLTPQAGRHAGLQGLRPERFPRHQRQGTHGKRVPGFQAHEEQVGLAVVVQIGHVRANDRFHA